VSTGSRNQPVDSDIIEWIGAAANYAVIHWNGREGLVRETLKTLEQRLDPEVFVRIHRSSIANLAMVESASSLSDGSWRLVMKSGDELVVSRTHRDQILARLGRRAP
jgi:DNA-binding LytR/AlgR family response regulator